MKGNDSGSPPQSRAWFYKERNFNERDDCMYQKINVMMDFLCFEISGH